MRQASLIISIVAGFTSSLFLLAGGYSPAYGIVDIAFCIMTVEAVLFKRKYPDFVPVSLSLMLFALYTSSFFLILLSKEIDMVLVAGIFLAYCTSFVVGIFYTTYCENYVIKNKELISLSIAIFFMLVTLVAIIINKDYLHLLFIIPNFLLKLFLQFHMILIMIFILFNQF